MASGNDNIAVLLLLLVYALIVIKNEDSSKENLPAQTNEPSTSTNQLTEQSLSHNSITMLTEESIDKVLGKWKTVYVNALWTTENCEEIAYERATDSDRENFEQIYENIEWERVKLKFIQDGDVIAVLLQKEIPGVFATVSVNEVVEVPEDELSSFQYVLLGDDFMVVNDLNVDESGYILLLSRKPVGLQEVKDHLDLVGVNVFNVTGCVVPQDHDEL